MSDYTVDIMKRPSRGYDVLVALPLAFVTIFCFVFVMLHPYYKPQAATATAIVANGNKTHSEPSKVVVELTEPLSPLTTVATPPTSTTSSADLSSNTATLSTSSSTSSKINIQQSSSSGTTKLQAASATSGKTTKPVAKPKVTLPSITLPSLSF